MADPRQVLKAFIRDVAHVGFVVTDLAEAVANARRVYGLAADDVSYQPEPGEEAATRFAFFEVGGLVFELIEPCSDYFQDILLAMPSGGAGINHVAWRVDDIDDAVALLARHEIYPGHVTPNGVVAIGEKKMVYLDPATTGGLIIELIEYPPGDVDAP
jgi:methylmalonyl-CoA/ethylmalonyl-CoA epimerase